MGLELGSIVRARARLRLRLGRGQGSGIRIYTIKPESVAVQCLHLGLALASALRRGGE